MSNTLEHAIQSNDGNPALLDTATGALSRAAFTLRLEEAAALAARLGHGVSLALFELCRPRALGRTHGPAAVDTVLAGVVDRVWELARRSDTLARLGPARLAILLPATDRASAELYATRLLPRLSAAPYPVAGAPVRVRFGMAVVGTAAGEAQSGTALLEAADAARIILPARRCLR